jgi:hypothetical protein
VPERDFDTSVAHRPGSGTRCSAARTTSPPTGRSWPAWSATWSPSIRQFLDIGTGLPTANNTHEVAQRAAPESRFVYVDNDPIVLAHARALLTSDPRGATAYLDADLRETRPILDQARQTLDFGQPDRRHAAGHPAVRPRRR